MAAPSLGYLTRSGTAAPEDAGTHKSTREGLWVTAKKAATVFNARRLGAELLGTFILTFTHAALALSVPHTRGLYADVAQRLNITGQGIGAGLTLIGIILALGQVSGAHFNPAVSWGFFLKGDMPVWLLLAYWLSQFAGAFIAAGFLRSLFPPFLRDGCLGATSPFGLSSPAAFFLESILTFIFIAVVLGSSSRGKNVGGLSAMAVGFTLGMLTLIGANYGGGSMNPARSLAPNALCEDSTVRRRIWIFFAGPFLVATIAAMIMRLLTPPAKRHEELAAALGHGGAESDQTAPP